MLKPMHHDAPGCQPPTDKAATAARKLSPRGTFPRSARSVSSLPVERMATCAACCSPFSAADDPPRLRWSYLRDGRAISAATIGLSSHPRANFASSRPLFSQKRLNVRRRLKIFGQEAATQHIFSYLCRCIAAAALCQSDGRVA